MLPMLKVLPFTLDNSLVVCTVCNNNFKRITHKHLAKHGLTISEYVDLYGVSDLAQRIFANCRRREDGCLEWLGARSSGYGRQLVTTVDGFRTYAVHRLVFESVVGDIPTGLFIDHLCHPSDGSCRTATCLHRRCCEPTHLAVVTNQQNNQRGNAQFNGNNQRIKTHCRNGHPYDEKNTIIVHRRNGHSERKCRICEKETQRRFIEKKKRLTSQLLVATVQLDGEHHSLRA